MSFGPSIKGQKCNRWGWKIYATRSDELFPYCAASWCGWQRREEQENIDIHVKEDEQEQVDNWLDYCSSCRCYHFDLVLQTCEVIEKLFYVSFSILGVWCFFEILFSLRLCGRIVFGSFCKFAIQCEMKDACLVCALMANIIVRSNVGMYNLIFYMLISLMEVWGFFFWCIAYSSLLVFK